MEQGRTYWCETEESMVMLEKCLGFSGSTAYVTCKVKSLESGEYDDRLAYVEAIKLKNIR